MKKLQKPDIRKSLKTRSFRVGGYSVVAAVIVVAIAVVVNLFVSALPATMTQFDTTSSQLFTISEETKTVLSGLDTDVTIYWVVESGQEDTTLETLLGRYAALSSHIHVTKKDPDVSPGFVTQYTDAEYIYNNSLVVESDRRSTYVGYEDIYEYDYSNYYTTYTYDVNFAGEGLVTSAIRYVTSDSMPKVYLLTGHGEGSLSESFASAVARENMETAELTLLTQDSVPADADCVLIYAPQSDISEAEKDMLLSYLQGGGNIFLITDPPQDGTLPNLYALMEEYGVSAQEGLVIEGNPNYYAYSTPYCLLPDYGSHTIVSPLVSGGYYVMLPIAQGLTVSEDLRDGLTVAPLLTTSDSAFSKLAGYNLETYEKEDGDIDGPFDLAVAVTDEAEDGTTAHIVWVSSASLLDDSTNEMVSGGNQDLFLNALGWMCETEDSVTIHSKTLSTDYLTVSSATASLLSIVLVGILPLGYLAIGLVIYMRRRRR